MPRVQTLASSLIVACLICLPRIAAACPACFAASDQRVSRMYFASGLLLSLLPLAIIGGIARWWWRRFAAGEQA
jgi:hypothetical protein